MQLFADVKLDEEPQYSPEAPIKAPEAPIKVITAVVASEEIPIELERVTVVAGGDDLSVCGSILRDAKVIAFDCEGIDLCREGALSIVQLATKKYCFLFDVYQQKKEAEIVKMLKDILESDSIIKVIHDVRMDCDALLHQFGIRVTNIHDTQVFTHQFWTETSVRKNLGLNDTLKLYECRENILKDKGIYKSNPAFWATRPLCSFMTELASQDVFYLLDLYEKQVLQARSADSDGLALTRCIALCEERLAIRDQFACLVQINPMKIGLFIGRGGSNINSLISDMSSFGCHLQGLDGRGKKGLFIVYANDSQSLKLIKAKIRKYF